ncbi:gag-protease polyprotein [Cucumis melo var. makuwa]|uniref:Gag-protease polyprotein n=1 Tax=Cucumis melo var. makuwa TaxID=1194695 RepID=A0A5A7T540_CUCMM|nr:gag-protease polyprotein [Cucumis melo var. makuwa]
MDSIKGHNQVSGKGFPTTGPRIEAGNVVIHRGLYTPMPERSVYCSYVNGLCCELELYVDGLKSLKVRLIRASFGITRLICVSFGIIRLIGVSLEVRVQRGADRRGARRIREGHMDASGFLYASADSVFCVLMAKTILATLQGSFVVVRKILPRRGARRDGRGGRGRRAGRVQPEEQQQLAPPAPAPALASVPVVPQVVPDQLSAEAKHLRDFRKYNPTMFDGSLEDPTRAQLWLSSLETIFRYVKCPEDQKVQCAIFMLTDRGTAW